MEIRTTISKVKTLYLITSICILIFACTNKRNKSEKFTSVPLETDDRQFLALKDTAQSHLQMSIDSLSLHGADPNYEFHIKSDFVEGETHEHMWSIINSYRDEKFHGRFIDSAFVLKHIKGGDPVNIVKQDLEDWIIYNNKDHVKIGDFSGKYLNSKQQ